VFATGPRAVREVIESTIRAARHDAIGRSHADAESTLHGVENYQGLP
jgi:hypothetical protein